MTIVVWDGHSLAADKSGLSVGYARTVTKIFRVPAGIVGFAGDGDHALRLLDWFQKGCLPEEYPIGVDGEAGASAMLVRHDGTCWSYGKFAHPQRCEDKFDAMGAGRDYALAAMYLGCDARRAVEVACALDVTCGKGIDVLTLEVTPTHQCKTCGALWKLWKSDEIHPGSAESWNLRSATCGSCCDNAPMDDQMQELPIK